VIEEARLEESSSGLVPVTDGWFVVNVRDAAWETGPFGAACFFEGADAPFAQLGINVRVLSPGWSKYLYHAESNQENFLVLSGECLLIVEGQERLLRTWDFMHCPPETAHAFVATGDSPCIIVMTGARSGGWPGTGIFYPRSDVALRHRVGVEEETSSPAEAQASLPDWEHRRPDGWNELPWA
jgi:uncharacterized cupin superfamily protein